MNENVFENSFPLNNSRYSGTGKNLQTKYDNLMIIWEKLSLMDFTLNKNSNNETSKVLHHLLGLLKLLSQKTLNNALLLPIEISIFDIVVEIHNFLKDFLNMIRKEMTSLVSKQKEMEDKIAENEEKMKEKVEKITISSPKPKIIHKKVNPDCFLANSNSNLNFQLAKVEHENELLKKKLEIALQSDKSTQFENKLKNVMVESETSSKEKKYEIVTLRNKISNLEFILNEKKEVIRNLEKENFKNKENFKEYQKNAESLVQKEHVFESKIHLFWEREMMLNEEIEGLKENFKQKMEIINKVKDNYFKIRNRFDEEIKRKNFPDEHFFKKDECLLGEIRAELSENPTFYKVFFYYIFFFKYLRESWRKKKC